MEYALVGNLHAGMGIEQLLLLQLDQTSTNFDDIVPRPFVNHRMRLLKVVQDIHSQGSISSTNFVDDEVLVWEVLQQVFRNDTLR